MNSTIIKSAIGTVLGIIIVAVVIGLAWLGNSALAKHNKEVALREHAVYCKKIDQIRTEENKQFLATHPVGVVSNDINPAAEGGNNGCN